ncbi:protein NEOXANTHIN-DEFICIENT 1 isoform X1 [Mercurialis annua]|uniref:protein NEOXANTHIN-DEFICIENT 1 isoform X1 n=1 Tax=Mercurialis annua TaxID=3986 RepID=UPI0021605DD8|nr:protein NEOXANTHIN-DEFICIENT 1 isoform X1 [Mercurialis annua]
MGVAQTKRTSAYSKPPWIFKGSALYQLHLVKAETARAFIPKEFRLVEAFGYTLGGFFLANYEDSPAGPFDELVVIAGLVWNPPTSCAPQKSEIYHGSTLEIYFQHDMEHLVFLFGGTKSCMKWAARVLVSSDDACDHGRKEVGLPSHVAKFSKRTASIPRKQKSINNCFLEMIGLETAPSRPDDRMDVQVTEINSNSTTSICNINFATAVPGLNSDKWMGPKINMSLPSFSGRTEYNPNLLKYSCDMECRVRAVQPARVLSAPKVDAEESFSKTADSVTGGLLDNGQNLSISVMLSKPILALEFSCLKMQVKAPTVVSDCYKTPGRTSLGVS